MTGDFESVIGMGKDEPLNRFLRKLPGSKFEPADGPATLCAIAVETDDATRACGKSRCGPPRRHSGTSAAGILELTYFIPGPG